MGYIGATPSNAFINNDVQRLTNSTNNYVDLDHNISSLDSVIVFVNNVRQESTNLTFTSASRIGLGDTLTTSDVVEIVFIGKAVATQSAAANSITNTMLAGSIANSKLANSSITLNGSAVSLGGSASLSNTPSFAAYLSNNSDQSISDSTTTKIQFDAERFDTAGAFDTSNYKFVVPSGQAGKYFIVCEAKFSCSSQNAIVGTAVHIYKNGSSYHSTGNLGAGYISGTQYPILGESLNVSTVIDLAVGDYIEGYGFVKVDSGTPKIQEGNDTGTWIEGFKLVE